MNNLLKNKGSAGTAINLRTRIETTAVTHVLPGNGVRLPTNLTFYRSLMISPVAHSIGYVFPVSDFFYSSLTWHRSIDRLGIRFLSSLAGDGNDKQVISREQKARIIKSFWKSFYKKLSISMDSKSPANMYQDEVIKLLIHSKSLIHTDFSEELQKRIEYLSMNFTDDSVFNSVPSLMQLLISKDKITAKEYLLQKNLSDTDLDSIKVFGLYTHSGDYPYSCPWVCVQLCQGFTSR